MSEENEPLSFASIQGAEIFATGTWNGIPFKDEDLDAIVRSFDGLSLAGKVPLKLGHNGPDVRDDPTTQFAMGWVKRVWKEGRKLMADLDVPEKVHKLIKEGHLKFVSVELLKNVKASTREIPWVLDAVALLGTDAPAVGVLSDLQTLAMSRTASSLAHGGRVTFSRASYNSTISTGDKASMSEDNKATIQELLDKVTQLTMQNAALQDEVAKSKPLKAEMARLEGRLNETLAANEKRARDERRAQFTAILEAAIREEEITPSAKERFWRTHKADDDEVIMSLTEADVKEFIRSNPNPVRKRKPEKISFALDRPDGDVPAGTLPDAEVALRAKALLATRGVHTPDWQQLASAAKEVFAANPSLGEKYKFLPDTLAREARG